MDLISQNAKIAQAIAPDADLYNGGADSDIFSLSNYNNICFVLNVGEGGTGTADVTVESCDDTSGSTATEIAFKYAESTTTDTFGELTASDSDGFTTTAGAGNVYLIEVSAEDLSGTDEYVRLALVENANDPVDAGAIAILYNPRYASDSDDMPTAIS